MKFFNKIKRKIHCLLERIKLSEHDYLSMKAQSQMYKAMMATIKHSSSADYEDIKDADGNLIQKLLIGKTVKLDIDIVELLAEGGITFDKNAVKLNVTGF